MEFILASKNMHKKVELQEILRPFGITLVLQSQRNLDVDVEETGTTFAENARLKAQAVMQASGLPAIADDSGLVVDALHGAPGVYSARYGGKCCSSDEDRYHFLLQNMQDVPWKNRTARFICCICCVFPDGHSVTATGSCEGYIAQSASGEQGFGYDPVFYLPEFHKTFAEIDSKEKNKISHRGNAIRAFCALMQKEKNYADK